MRPAALFDTELAGRLAGFARVGLGAMVENVLGLRAGEGPLGGRLVHPPAARAVAAVRRARRRAAGRPARRAGGGAARAGQAGLGARRSSPPSPPPPPAAAARRPVAPHVRHAQGARRRQLGVVRELWLARDALAARERDVVARPGAARRRDRRRRRWTDPPNAHALAALPGFGHRMGRRQLDQWQAAIDRAARAARARAAAAGRRVRPVRRRRARGPTRTRPPPPGCPRPAPRWPRSPRS